MEQREKMIRVGVLVSRLLESSNREHCSRIRMAKKAIDILSAFIETEVYTANNLPKNDSARMSWDQIAQALGISKTAAYARYGANSDKRTQTTHTG